MKKLSPAITNIQKSSSQETGISRIYGVTHPRNFSSSITIVHAKDKMGLEYSVRLIGNFIQKKHLISLGVILK